MDNARKEEQAYLSRVLEVVDNLIESLEGKLPGERGEVLRVREEAYRKSSHIIRSFDDIVSLSMYEQEVQKSEQTVLDTYKALGKAVSQKDSPYFGRIDFDDGDDITPIYIGRHELIGDERLVPYICDWRSPAASMFYDFDAGPAWYDAPSGRIEGGIGLKRQFKIAKSEIEYMLESDVTVNDEILARALSESGGDKLKVIVSSIQREQNAAIRHKAAGTLIITGPAGSGKTSVGMHRLAWMLYHNRGSLKSEEIAVISKSSVFSSYIANILPELGEDDVNRPVFDDLIKAFTPKGYGFSDYYGQLSHITRAGKGDARIRDIEIKYSAGFIEYIAAYLASHEFDVWDIAFDGETICSAARLRELASGAGRRYPFNVTAERITLFIKDECDEYFKMKSGDIKRRILEESDEILYDSEVNMRFRSLTRGFIQEKLDDFNAANGLSDEAGLYLFLLEKFLNGADTDTQTRLKLSIEKKSLYYEDLMLILYIKTLTGGIAPKYGVKHVLIDEAQDYSLPQLMILRHLYSNGSFTVLADPYQAVCPAITSPSIEAISKPFPGARFSSLNNSYRCTSQIFSLARSYIGMPDMEGFRRDGPEPVYLEGKSPISEIAAILRDKNVSAGTTAIIVKKAKEAKRIHSLLKGSFDIQLVSSERDEIKTGTVVIPFMLSKGLEFDTTVIADSFDDWDEGFRGRLMYMLCTRALHRLYLV